jgi:hypothetical protein
VFSTSCLHGYAIKIETMFVKGQPMLHTYEAQLQGNQVTWLGVPPPSQTQPRRVVVILNESLNEDSPASIAEILQHARGSLGKSDRELVLAELVKSRQEWER